ncbi:MAG: hypothetical protein V4572_02410 [Bacteroidota bacterium]
MRKIALYILILVSLSNCKAQQQEKSQNLKITARYVGQKYKETQNISFLNDELQFLKDKDNLVINIKIPYDSTKPEILKQGIFYNCELKHNIVYTFTLKKICVSDIPSEFNSYYKTNATFSDSNCSKFTEKKVNTNYQFKGTYGKYVDIDNELYEVIDLLPNDNCNFSH